MPDNIISGFSGRTGNQKKGYANGKETCHMDELTI
jgi:hypothetical protein